ncbi:VOC family protein [Stieleria mannarensis]|uniref:VOC family protein n=1 Tax=Stieleria mannarensis TaxID=2755585 RepID=UPI001601221C|nr:VOC family protein [Rhodopirellula sp. JC639]
MQFGYTLLYVADVEQTLTFYEAAFGLARKFVHTDGDQAYGELDTGAVTLGFVSHALAKSHGFDYAETRPDGPAAAVEIAFTTDDVQMGYDRAVSNGAVAVSPPKTKPWGQTVSYVRDNNGFLVEICSPMGG